MISRRTRRKITNVVMFTLTGVCTFLAVSVLFFILGYLVWQGGHTLNWNFFTQLPAPVGETGGGFANAIVGSAKLLLLASLIGVPIGFLGGVYLAEFGGTTPAFVVRYTADLLNGVPSIVMGIFAYVIIVVPLKQFSTFAGGLALGVMMIPIAVRSTEDFLRAVPNTLREGGGHSSRPARHYHWNPARPGQSCGGDGASAFHGFRQPVLESRLESTHGLAAGHDF